jgi:hypothetical protein
MTNEELLERIKGNSEKIRELIKRIESLEKIIQSMIEVLRCFEENY